MAAEPQLPYTADCAYNFLVEAAKRSDSVSVEAWPGLRVPVRTWKPQKFADLGAKLPGLLIKHDDRTFCIHNTELGPRNMFYIYQQTIWATYRFAADVHLPDPRHKRCRCSCAQLSPASAPVVPTGTGFRRQKVALPQFPELTLCL
jgi:hypothetical protein